MAEQAPSGTVEELREMDLEQTLAFVGNAVYQVATVLERLEDADRIQGNGHHMAQELSARAQGEVIERWRDRDEVARLSPSHPGVIDLSPRA